MGTRYGYGSTYVVLSCAKAVRLGRSIASRGIQGGEDSFTLYQVTHGDLVDRLQRGIHNVENELIFRSNDKLVFHDSQGFEAGREDEFLQMRKFIEDRAKTTILKKRIHAIW